MISNTAKLVNTTYTYDSIGQPVETETFTEIFIEERSITRTEWAEAGRIGHNPSIQLATPYMNYDGQEEVEYKGVRYAIYRTYQHGDIVELYLEKKGGV